MALSEFLKSVLGGDRHANLAQTQKFAQLDIDVIRKRLDLEAKGHERGAQNLPSSDSAGPDTVETDIVAVINMERDEALNRYQDARRVMADRATSYGFAARLSEIATAAQSAIASFHKTVQDGSTSLYQDRRKLKDHHESMDRFKAKHRIDWPSRRPRSRLLRVGLMLALFLVEAAVNGTFLAEGDSGYLIGGVGKAIGIAAINVVVSFLIGWHAMRWIWHRSWLWKLPSLVLTVAWLVFLTGFNLGVAQYRLASGGPDGEHAAEIAFQKVITTPFFLPDFVAWVLFFMGLFFGIFALFDGLFMDEFYPSYGPRAHALDESEHDYADRKNELLGELEEIKAEAERRITECAQDLDSWQGGFRSLVVRNEGLKQAFLSHLDHVENAANSLLRAYRDENIKHRTTAPPRSFEEPYRLVKPSLDGEDRVFSETAAQIEKVLGRADGEIKVHRQEMLAAYERAVDEYRRIDVLVADELPPIRAMAHG